MKTLIISFMLFLGGLAVQAQDVTVLDEARIFYAPLNVSVTQEGDSFTYKIDEASTGQFAKDPIGFMKNNFDIHNFIAHVADKNYDAYQVIFKSNYGSLVAEYDKEGNLINTSQNFKNVVLPLNMRRELHETYKGWTLTKTKYSARTKGEILANATYRVQLQNGRQKQNLKIDAINEGIGVAVN